MKKKLVSSKKDTDFSLCFDCTGKGEIDVRVSAYDTESQKCKTCNGRGSLMVVTTKEFFTVA